MRKVIISFIAMTLVAVNAGPNLVSATNPQPVILQSPTALRLNGTLQVVNNGPGDQTEPDVDCNLISYRSNDFQGHSLIHVLPPTNVDYVLPGNGVDSQPDVNGNRVGFSELWPTGDGIAVFDTLYQMRTDIPGFKRSNPAIGGDLVAYEDRSFFAGPNLSELGIYDLGTGVDIRLTNDTLFDKNPAISPTGNAVVWEKCQPDGTGCNIYAAVQTSPDSFTTRALTNGAGENRQPHTNGQIAVYISNRSGENDIYVQPFTCHSDQRSNRAGP